MKEIADAIHRSKPTVTVLVNKLVELNLVKKKQASADSRVVYVELTSQGKELRKVFEEVSVNLAQKVFQNLEPAEIKNMEASLKKILANLE
ncbi:MAG: hypothetical protein PHAS_02090 [Phascolarctobacterium sp.]